MANDEPKAYGATIIIIGALRTPVDAGQNSDFLRRVEQALFEVFPDFLPGRPPVTITWSELRDDWIKYGNR